MAMSKSPLHPDDGPTLRRLGETLFGTYWQASLAPVAGYSSGLLWEVAAGKQPMTPHLRSRLRSVVVDALAAEPSVRAERMAVLEAAQRRFSDQ